MDVVKTEITGYQRFERLGSTARRLKLWQWIPALSNQLPPSPARAPRNFSLCLRGSGLRGAAIGRTLLGRRPGSTFAKRTASPLVVGREVAHDKTTFCCLLVLRFHLIV